MISRSLYIISLSVLMSCRQTDAQSLPVQVSIRQEGNSYELLVDGAPYTIKGAGLEFGSIAELAEHGGNTFRTWRTDNGVRSAIDILDEAHSYGIKVVMGIDIARERHGFDYNDPVVVQQQLNDVRQQVIALKDHPALLIWGIGNELNLRATNPNVWNAVNDISRMIHEVDPNHLTTTSLAGISAELVKDIRERAPDLDLLSIQMYADIINLPQRIRESGWTGPYLVTEWGATGHWEVQETSWGAPVENNSTVKANYILERYQTGIVPELDRCLGAFIFLWGQKQERTPTWYGLYMEDGKETAAIDAMHFIWNNTWPENTSPAIDSVRLNGMAPGSDIFLHPGDTAEAFSAIRDADGDQLQFQWIIMPESTDLGDGGDFETTPPVITSWISTPDQATTQLVVPNQPGAYRLFLYAFDGHDHAAHANIPFYIK